MSTHISAQVVAAGALIAALGTAACTGTKAAVQAKRVQSGAQSVTGSSTADSRESRGRGRDGLGPVTQVLESAAGRAEGASRRLGGQCAARPGSGAIVYRERVCGARLPIRGPAPARVPLL
jgi:hypothetical protein